MTTQKTLILGSSSPYRRRLLEALGVPFQSVSPDCDEGAYQISDPLALAVRLARDKARSILTPSALVIGSDQVVDLGGRILGKPGTAAQARAQLRSMAGRSHRLITAVCVHDTDTGRSAEAVDIHTMTMRSLSDAQIAAYIDFDQPLDCAGSYKLEGRGIALFQRIEADPETADDTAIIGLPMMKTLALLRGFGVDILG